MKLNFPPALAGLLLSVVLLNPAFAQGDVFAASPGKLEQVGYTRGHWVRTFYWRERGDEFSPMGGDKDPQGNSWVICNDLIAAPEDPVPDDPFTMWAARTYEWESLDAFSAGGIPTEFARSRGSQATLGAVSVGPRTAPLLEGATNGTIGPEMDNESVQEWKKADSLFKAFRFREAKDAYNHLYNKLPQQDTLSKEQLRAIIKFCISPKRAVDAYWSIYGDPAVGAENEAMIVDYFVKTKQWQQLYNLSELMTLPDTGTHTSDWIRNEAESKYLGLLLAHCPQQELHRLFKFYPWDSQNIINVHFDLNGAAKQATKLRNDFLLALCAWKKTCPAIPSFQVVDDADHCNLLITCGHRATQSGSPDEFASVSRAYTPNYIASAYVLLYDNATKGPNAANRMRGVALHSIGHALGLTHHFGGDNTIMHCHSAGQELTPLDAKAMKLLYGAPSG